MPRRHKTTEEAPAVEGSAQMILQCVDVTNRHWAAALEGYAHSVKDDDRVYANDCMALAHRIRQAHGQRQGQGNPPKI